MLLQLKPNNMETLKVTTAELTSLLLNMPDSIGSFAKITQITEPNTTKKDRDTKQPFNDKIIKLSEVSAIVSTDYEKNVLNQLKREGKEETEYQKGVNTMPIDFSVSTNKFAGFFNGKGVIQYRPNPNEKNKPFVQYYLNNKAIEFKNLPNVLPVVNKAENQGTDKEILWRKLYISNIKQISIHGNVYVNIECEI
jgi:hypothetical protein